MKTNIEYNYKDEEWIADYNICNLNCICPERSHLLRLFYSKEFPDNLYVDVVFNPLFNFIQRFYVSLMYLFNLNGTKYLDKLFKLEYDKSTGEFDPIWDLDTVTEAINFLNQFRDDKELYITKKEDEIKKTKKTR